MKNIAGAVAADLFAEEGASVFAILDGASVPDLLEKLHQHRPEFECLYRGELKPDLAHAAPYLVRLEPDAELTEWILGQGWGNHWGVFVIAPADLPALRRHFRRLLIVHDGEGKPLYFRYYDPRVLRTYLPTCNAEELAAMFGAVVAYVLEDENPQTLLRFQAASGALVQKKTQLPPA